MAWIGNHFAERDGDLLTIRKGEEVIAMVHESHVRGMWKLERAIGERAMDLVENHAKRVYFLVEQ